MEDLVLTASDDHVARLAHEGDPVRAIIELIWNALDADATEITVEFGRSKDLYFGGDMEASIALSGQVAGRIDSIKPVKQIIDETVAEFFKTVRGLGSSYAA